MGTNYNPAAVAQLKPGQSKEEVVAILGKPTTTVRLANGTTHVAWNHSKGSMLSATARQVTLLFGPDGKFIEVVSETQTEFR